MASDPDVVLDDRISNLLAAPSDNELSLMSMTPRLEVCGYNGTRQCECEILCENDIRKIKLLIIDARKIQMERRGGRKKGRMSEVKRLIHFYFPSLSFPSLHSMDRYHTPARPGRSSHMTLGGGGGLQ